MNRNLPKVRWKNQKVWEDINLSRLAVATVAWPVVLSLPIFWLATWSQAFLALAALQAQAIVIAVAVIATRAHQGLASYQAAIDRGQMDIVVQPWIRALYQDPVKEYLLLGFGSAGLAWFSWIIAVAGGALIVATDNTIMMLLSGIPYVATGAGWVLVIFGLGLTARFGLIGLLVGLLLWIVGQHGLGIAVLITAMRGFFGQFEAERGTGSELNTTGSMYLFHAVQQGLLPDAARFLGGYAKAKNAITLASKEEAIKPESGLQTQGWQPVVGDHHRGQRIDTEAMLDQLRRYE